MAFAASALPSARPVARASARATGNARVQRTVARAEKGKIDKPAEEVVSEFDAEKTFKDLSERWDKVEDKSSVIVYTGGALIAVWLSATLVGAINSVPLLPKFMELVGLAYTAWFVYRYLLFKESRQELITDVEELKKKISGTDSTN